MHCYHINRNPILTQLLNMKRIHLFLNVLGKHGTPGGGGGGGGGGCCCCCCFFFFFFFFFFPFLNSKYTEYRLVFFWSLVLGVQTPKDGRTVFLPLEQQLT